ncbi:hypothetical protein B7494_g4302 [Chlorociboria aeruginascens]|nr:hypothetical protein B7494_g4302 [Chlorociboria aeruginascens]
MFKIGHKQKPQQPNPQQQKPQPQKRVNDGSWKVYQMSYTMKTTNPHWLSCGCPSSTHEIVLVTQGSNLKTKQKIYALYVDYNKREVLTTDYDIVMTSSSTRWAGTSSRYQQRRKTREVRDDLAAKPGANEGIPEMVGPPVPPPLHPTTNSDRSGFQQIGVEDFQDIPDSPTLSNHTSPISSTLPSESIRSITSESVQTDLAATRDELRTLREQIEANRTEINSLNQRLLMATQNRLNQREQEAAFKAEITDLTTMLEEEIQRRSDLNKQIDVGMDRERELLDRLMVVRGIGDKDSRRDSDGRSRSRRSGARKRKAKVPLGFGCFSSDKFYPSFQMARQAPRVQQLTAILQSVPMRVAAEAEIYRQNAINERLQDVQFDEVEMPIVPPRPLRSRVVAEALNAHSHIEIEPSRASVEFHRAIELPTPDASTISSPRTLRAADGSLECLEEQVSYMQTDIQLMKEQLDGREEEIGSLKTRLNDIEAKYQESITDLKVSEAEKDALRRNLIRLDEELKRMKHEKEGVEKELDAKQKELSDAMKKIADSESRRLEAAAPLRRAEYERRMNDLEAELMAQRATQQREDARRIEEMNRAEETRRLAENSRLEEIRRAEESRRDERRRDERRRRPQVKVVITERSQSSVDWPWTAFPPQAFGSSEPADEGTAHVPVSLRLFRALLTSFLPPFLPFICQAPIGAPLSSNQACWEHQIPVSLWDLPSFSQYNSSPQLSPDRRAGPNVRGLIAGHRPSLTNPYTCGVVVVQITRISQGELPALWLLAASAATHMEVHARHMDWQNPVVCLGDSHRGSRESLRFNRQFLIYAERAAVLPSSLTGLPLAIGSWGSASAKASVLVDLAFGPLISKSPRTPYLKKPQGVPGRSWPAILIGLFVAFGGVLFGYWESEFSTGYIDTKGHANVSPSQSAAIVSILSAGTFFGALGAAPLADFIGRKFALISSTLVFTFGVILQTASTELQMFLAGRFFAGFGVGLISALIPLYQSETAPKWIRGVIVGSYQFAITVGLLLAAVVDNATANRNDTGSYRIPVAVQFAWAIILISGMLLLPETPRYLIRQGNPEKAAASLSRLRRLPATHEAILDELAEIQANHDYELTLGKATYVDCFKGGVGKRLMTGCFLQGLQQLTGINFIFYYGTQYFKNSGIKNPFVITMITSAVNVASTLPGLYAIDKWGRRPLLFWGAIGMTVSQLLVAVLGTTTTGQTPDGNAIVKNLAAQKASIAFVCIYIFFFASTWGPIAWVVTGEIFPLKVRAKALSMTTATNWLLNWAIAYSTPYLVNFGPGNANLQSKIFFIWFACCFLCITFVYLMIYETKGLTLEQIDELYDEVKSARRSVGWVPTKTFREITGHTRVVGLGHERKDRVDDEKAVAEEL